MRFTPVLRKNVCMSTFSPKNTSRICSPAWSGRRRIAVICIERSPATRLTKSLVEASLIADPSDARRLCAVDTLRAQSDATSTQSHDSDSAGAVLALARG